MGIKTNRKGVRKDEADKCDTRLTDDVLDCFLIAAGRAVRARTSNVVVKVIPGWRLWGRAYECYRVRWKRSHQWTDTDGGAFKICLPLRSLAIGDPLNFAERIFSVARHEWGHIRDYQHGGRRMMDFSGGQRRPRHDRRPEEIRAENYVYESDSRGALNHYCDQILRMAIELESLKKGGEKI